MAPREAGVGGSHRFCLCFDFYSVCTLHLERKKSHTGYLLDYYKSIWFSVYVHDKFNELDACSIKATVANEVS